MCVVLFPVLLQYRPIMLGEISTTGNFNALLMHQITNSWKVKLNAQVVSTEWPWMYIIINNVFPYTQYIHTCIMKVLYLRHLANWMCTMWSIVVCLLLLPNVLLTHALIKSPLRHPHSRQWSQSGWAIRAPVTIRDLTLPRLSLLPIPTS